MFSIVMSSEIKADWNSFGRANASQRWRQESAEMGRHVTEALVQAAQIEPGMRVLDVACGTGEPAISIASQLNSTGKVAAIDISEAPLKIGRARAAQRGLEHVQFLRCNAQALSFPDNTFDRITSRLGVMFFSDLSKAISEMHRVLKPGGRVTLLAWGSMHQPYFETTVGAVLRALGTAALPDSGKKMFAFGEPGALGQKLHEAGFVGIEEKFPTVPWSWQGTPQEVWEYFQEVTIPFAPLFKAIPQDARAAVNAAVIEAISRYYEGQQINFTATVNISSATK